MKTKSKKGISLIVLVITIIVMIVLAAAIIITLSNNGIIGKANEAVERTNLKQAQELAQVIWAEGYLKNKDATTIKADIVAELGDAASKYNITVTDKGVTVTLKQSGTNVTSFTWEATEPTELVTATSSDGTIVAYKISDVVPTQEELNGAVFNMVDSTTGEIFLGKNLLMDSSLITQYSDDIYAAFLVIVVTSDETNFNGVIFPESGVYMEPSTLKYNLSVDWGIQNADVMVLNNSILGYTGENEEELVIPSVLDFDGKKRNVVSLDEFLFNECTNLKSVVLPDSLIRVENNIFSNCTNLASVTFGKNIEAIGSEMFSNCSSLEEIVLPESVSEIKNSAFMGCTSLVSITIPKSTTTIKNQAFDGCTALTDIYYTGSEEEWNAISIDGSNDVLKNATMHFNYVAAE